MQSNSSQHPQAVERPALVSGDLFGVWQPIETAPRGETVLLYVSNAIGHKHVKTGIAYPTNHPDLEIVSIFDDGDALGYLPEKYAMRWMPLPPSPNTKISGDRREERTDVER